MKLFIFLVALFSISSLFGGWLTSDEPSKVKAETSVAKTEASDAKTEASALQIEAKKLAKANSIIERNAIEKAQSKNGDEELLEKNRKIYISVVGQGVAPMNTVSPAQAYALAKRAAVADAYRGLAEKVKGVRVEGYDLVKNMMMQRSTIRTGVEAMVKNANVVETTFKEGLCEVEMEIVISYSDFSQ